MVCIDAPVCETAPATAPQERWMADGCTLGNFLVQNRLNISYVAKLSPTYGAMPCGSDQTINGVMLSDLHLPRYIADGSTYEDRRDNSLVGGQRTLCPHNIDEGLPDACRVTEESARELVCVCINGPPAAREQRLTFVLLVGSGARAESSADEVQRIRGDHGRDASASACAQKSKRSGILLHLQPLQPGSPDG
jgi:hypothetical protein